MMVNISRFTAGIIEENGILVLIVIPTQVIIQFSPVSTVMNTIKHQQIRTIRELVDTVIQALPVTVAIH